MATLKDRISNEAYKTWLKAGLCLGFLKDGLCPFIDRGSQTLHSNVLAKVRQSVLGTGVFGPLPQCTFCTAQDITWSNRGRRWELTYVDPTTGHEINYCPNHLCHHFMTAIQQEHVSPQPRGMCWENGNTQAWPSSHWEVAKTLMDVMEGGPMKTSAEDCDCSSLLKFIEYSKVCQGKISVADAAQVRQHRNKIMHSATMALSSTELKIFANDMITLLKSLGDYNTNVPAQTAVQQIEQARETDIEITSGDEIQVLKATQQGIQDTVNKQLEDMKELKKTVEELETKTKEMDDVDKGVKEKTEEQGEEMQRLKEKLQEMEVSEQEKAKVVEENEEEMQRLKEKLQEMEVSEHEKAKVAEGHGEEMQRLKEKLQEMEVSEQEKAKVAEEHGEEMQRLKEKLQKMEVSEQEKAKVSEGHTGEMQRLKEKLQKMEISEKERSKVAEGHGEEMQRLKEKLQEMEVSEQEKAKVAEGHGEEIQRLKKKLQEMEVSEKEKAKVAEEHAEEMQQLKKKLQKMEVGEQKKAKVAEAYAGEMQRLKEKLQEVENSEVKKAKVAEGHGEEIRLLKGKVQEMEVSEQEKAKVAEGHAEEMQWLKEKLQEMEVCEREMSKLAEGHGEEMQRLKEKLQEMEVSEKEMSKLAEGHGEELQRFKEETTGMLEKQEERVENLQEIVKASGEETRKSVKDQSNEIKFLKLSQDEMKKELEEKLTYINTIEGRLQELQCPEKQHEHKCRELKQKLIKMYRNNCMEIPVSPLHTKQKTFPIQQLYTDLVLVEQEKRDSRARTEEGAEQRKETPLKSYSEVFCKGGTRQNIIFVLGEAGTGKSTLAKKMVADWVCAHTGGEGEKGPDVAAMEKFNFLFYVPLRAVPNCTSVFDAVCQSMAKYSDFEVTIKRLFQTQSEEILVICDGLDEVKLVLDQCHLHDCTVVTTTRPWKFDFVDQRDHHVDLVLELRGLTEEGIDYLTGKVLEVVYDDTNVVRKHIVQRALGRGRDYYFFHKEVTREQKQMIFEAPEGSEELRSLSKIPLLLVFFIDVWFKGNKSLPTSLTELFTNILVINLKCGENRLVGLESREACQSLWRECSHLKKLFGNNDKHLKPYAGLLTCVANFALQALICPNHEQSLVFEEEDVEEHFDLKSDRSERNVKPSVHIDACVRLGLLTKTEYPSFLGNEYTYSFPHKSIQEFLAAVGIARSPETGKSKFIQYCTSVRVLLEMSNIFKFVCGLSPETGSAISEELVKMYSVDPDLLKWRCEYQFQDFCSERTVCERLTSLYCVCVTESKGSGEILHMTDFVAERYNENKAKVTLINSNRTDLLTLQVENSVLQCINSEGLSDMKNLIYLDVDNISHLEPINILLDAAVNLQGLSLEGQYESKVVNGLCLPVLQHLRLLRLGRIHTSVNLLQALQTLLSLGQLEILHLRDISFGNFPLDLSPLVELRLEDIYMTWSVWCGLLSSLGSCHSLKTLNIQDIRPYREDTCTPDTRMDLSGCTQLQKVEIRRVNFGDIQLDFSPLVQLSKLRLWSIDMTWSVWCGLLSSLGSCHSLKALNIQDIRPGREDTCASDTRMDLSGCTQLQKVGIRRVNIGDIQLDFSPLVQLSRLALMDIDMTWSVWCGLLSSLGSCHSLETLDIWDIRPGREDTCTSDTRVDLSGCTQLQKVDIERINIGDIQLDFSPLIQVSELALMDIDMTWSVWCGLLSSLGSCHSLKTLNIWDIRPGREDTCTSDTRVDLSGCTQLQSVDIVRVNIGDIQLDFSPLVQLSKLRLMDIDMTWSVWCGLLSSLGSCHSLKTLNIQDIRPGREDTCTSDTRMDLSGCTQLQKVDIESVNICDKQLDFSPLVQLSELRLKSIDMTWCVWCGFLSSLGSCHTLKTLDIQDIRPDREDTCTPDTRMDLSGCTQLQKVDIERVNIGDIQLDFSPLVQLSKLRLKSIDMTWCIWCGLLSSLESCHSLKTLDIQDIRPDREDTCTPDTRMDLSGCTQLQKVDIERVNIGDIQLDLSPLVQLSELRLKGIDMTWCVWSGLLSSLGSCHSLKTLYIQGIRPDREDTCTPDTRMDLSGCTKLQKVDIERVNIGDIQLDFSPLVQLAELRLMDIKMTWCVWCGLLSSLGSCHSLMTLNIQNIRPGREDTCTSDTRMDLSGCTQLQNVDITPVNIGDIQLDFSPLVQLSVLRLEGIDMTWSVCCGLLSSLGSCHSLKTLYIEGIRPDREDTCTPDTRMDLSGCAQLQKVAITKVNIGDIQLDFSPLVQLSDLRLEDIDMTWSVWCGLLSLLGSCYSLETLYIQDIRPDREDTCTPDTRMDLSGCTQLQKVDITKVNIGDIQLDFSPLVQLSKLRLENIDMTWSVWCGLLPSLGSCHSLKTLYIKGIRPTCTLGTEEDLKEVDLSGCRKLLNVIIIHSNGYAGTDTEITCKVGPDSTQYLSPLVSSLSQVTCLTGLAVGSLDTDGVNIFKTILPRLCNLTELTLQYMNFGDYRLSLHHNQQLQKLKLVGTMFTSGVLDLSHKISLKELNLSKTIFVNEQSALHEAPPMKKARFNEYVPGTGVPPMEKLRFNEYVPGTGVPPMEKPRFDEYVPGTGVPPLEKPRFDEYVPGTGVLPMEKPRFAEYVPGTGVPPMEKPRFAEAVPGTGVPPMEKPRFAEAVPGTGQLLLASNMKLQELVLHQLTLSEDTWSHVFTCVHNMEQLRTLKLSELTLSEDTWNHVFTCVHSMEQLKELQLQNVNTTINMVRVPAHMYIKDKCLDEDSTISSLECLDKDYLFPLFQWLKQDFSLIDL